MSAFPELQPYQLVIRSEYEIITMRQELRQTARQLGLPLTQQAKITAGVSGLARALLTSYQHLQVRVQLLQQRQRRLEIHYQLRGGSLTVEQLDLLLSQEQSRLLFDEVTVRAAGDTAQVILEVWLK